MLVRMVRDMHTTCMVTVAFIGTGGVEFTRVFVADLGSPGELHGDRTSISNHQEA